MNFDGRPNFVLINTDQAVRWLYNRDPSRPFFLTVGYNQPHVPNNPPAYYLDRYERMPDLGEPVIGDWAVPPANNGIGLDLDNCPYVNLEGVNQHTCFAGYYGSINHLDDSIGRLLTFLNVSGLVRNTYIIFTADHGEMLGDHYIFHLVPILRAEKHGPVRDYIHGECLLNSPGEPLPGQQVEYNPVFEQGMQYVTDGREKYIRYPKNGIEQFFNLEEDPNECRNQVDSPAYAGRVEHWRGCLFESLNGRPEGYVEKGRLKSGVLMQSRLPNAQAQYERWRATENVDPSHRHDNLMMFFPTLQA